MRTCSNQPSFPFFSALAALTVAAAITYSILWLLISNLIESVALTHESMLVAGLVGWFSSIIAIVPMGFVGRHGLMANVAGYFLGAAMRVLICVVATVIAVKTFEYSPSSWAVMMMGMYLVLLFVEVSFVARHIWSMTAAGDCGRDLRRNDIHTEVAA